jgi:hypothetical protein
MQLGREKEVGIHLGHNARPQLGNLRLDVTVKRGVDLDHVEAARHQFQRMLLPARHPRWIEDAFPVLV